MKRLAAAALISGMLLGVGIRSANTANTDERVARCGGGPATVSAVFDIPEARRIWEFLPALKVSPELARSREQASVVVYEGEYPGLILGRTGLRRHSSPGAVCVITAEYGPIVYSDVSREGFRHP